MVGRGRALPAISLISWCEDAPYEKLLEPKTENSKPDGGLFLKLTADG